MTSGSTKTKPKDVTGRTYQYLAMLSCNLNIICSGLHYGWTSPSLEKLATESNIQITQSEGSWIAVAILFGTFCGSLSSSVIANKIGRKNSILLTSLPFFISWMLLAYAKSLNMIIFARYLAGIPDGIIFCTVPVYLAEIADPKIRGFMGSSCIICMTLGILIMNFTGYYFTITTAAIISSIFPLLLVVTFFWIPESPYYFIMKGNMEKARKSLILFRCSSDVDEELMRITKAVKEQNTDTGKYLDLFTDASNRKAVFIMIGVRTVNQLTGNTAIIFYAQMIFKEAGDSISPVIASAIYFTIQMVCTAISSIVVDKTGRRPLLIISVIGVFLTLLIEGILFCLKGQGYNNTFLTVLPIVALLVYVVMFNIGIQTIPILLVGEIFPTNVKAFAASLHDVYFCVLCITVSKFFQFSKDEFGMHVPFFFFAFISILGFVFIVLYVPETKGKTLEEIQCLIKGIPVEQDCKELEVMCPKS